MNVKVAKRRAREKQRKERERGLTVVECRVCGHSTPGAFVQQHHEIPRAADGHQGPKVDLCAGCHQSLHRVVDMLMSSKRAGLAEDSVRIMYPDQPEARERMFALAQTVVEYMTLKRDGKIDTKAPVRVMIELPPEVKLAAQMIANDHRGPTGRRLGLATWIASLVKREVYDRYPNLRPEA